MKTTSALVLALLAVAAASVIPAPERKVAEKELLVKQKQIMQLLVRVHQPNQYPEQVEIGKNYDLEAHIENFKEPEVVKHFLTLYKAKHGLLPHGEVFSVSYRKHKHTEQAVALFDLFYFAKDYDTFYKTACWARDHVNEGLFVYALSVAVLHREDLHDIILPPPYEIYPQLFVHADVIQQSYEARMHGVDHTVIIANYSGWEHRSNPEQLLSYFTEDVGLNTYSTYLHYEYPFWMSTKRYQLDVERRGELFYYTQQQLLARYQLERLSNGLKGVEFLDPVSLDIHHPIQTGYNPNLSYKNGQAIPALPEGITLNDIDLVDIHVVEHLENRLLDAIDSGIVWDDKHTKIELTKENGINILGNLVVGNGDSVNQRYYGHFYLLLRSIYGHIVDPVHHYGVAPGVLDHFQTALRDPTYYRIVKRILELFEWYKSHLQRYTHEELSYAGVKIESVEVDKLITYFDDFEFDLNGVVETQKVEDGDKLDIRVRQPRLTHKPFSLHVNVDSDKAAKVLVRVFLGPKYDSLGNELSIEEKKNYFVELDRFPYDIEVGKTVIERNSRQSTAIVNDHLSYRVLLKKVDEAIAGKEPFYVESNHRHCGYPEHLQLPKGTKSGLPLTLFVIVSPYVGTDLHTHNAIISCGAGIRYTHVDTHPLGFPFDREIVEYDFYTPNMYEKDVIVFHKKQEEINKAI